MSENQNPLFGIASRIKKELNIPENSEAVSSYLRNISTGKVHDVMLKVYSTNSDGNWIAGSPPVSAYEVVRNLREKHDNLISESDYEKNIRNF